MKKILSLLLVLAMMVPVFALAEGAEPSGKLVVGSTTEISGTNIFTTQWGNNASDKSIRDLIFPLDTVVYTRNAKFEVNPTVVKEMKSEENEDGSKTFTMTINEGLVYNDNTPINAKDYLFSTLLTASRAMDALGGTTPVATEVVGRDEYRGEDENAPIVDVPFKGLRLLDDYTLSVTIKAEELPYYYDLAYAGFTPYPIHVIAPGAEVKDDGEGAYITGDFTVEVLEKTINDPDSGYRYFPMVTAGPYKFVSFDRGTKIATVEANPLYAGNYEGTKPQIKTIVYTLVDEKTLVESLRTGAVDMIQGLSGKDIVNTMDMIEEENAIEENKFSYYNYPRAGYGKIAFHCDFFPTDSVAVRQALALSLDRPEFARQYSDGYAQVVNSRYGVAQWMYFENQEEVEAAMDPYTMDLERAKNLLIEDGWVFDENGGEYKEGIRYKEVDGEYKPLIIKWADTDNSVAQLLRQMLPENLEQIGMKLDPQVVDFPVMLEGLYRSNDPTPQFNMFNLGTGFATADSPWFYYDTNPEYFGQYNSNFLADEQLRDITANMKKADNDDDYYKNWFDFVVRFNEILPDIPLYSDDYHDFFIGKLQNYEVTSLYSFADAIIDCSLAE